MSIFAVASERRKAFAATPEGQKKALKRRRRMRVGKVLLIVALIAFAVLFAVITMNAHFHWWETIPF